jgi:hypothetical protein
VPTTAVYHRLPADTASITGAVHRPLGGVSHQAFCGLWALTVGPARCIQASDTVVRDEPRVGDEHHPLTCRSCGATADVVRAVRSASRSNGSHDRDLAVDGADSGAHTRDRAVEPPAVAGRRDGRHAERHQAGHAGHGARPRPLAVFDIDGVLADVTHRLHHLRARPQRWERFFAAAEVDPLLAPGAERLRAAQPDHDVVYLTGRPEQNRRLTERWLAGHGLPTGPLFMREDDDYRPARMMKREVLWLLADRREIAAVIDDDPAVVRVLAADGWPVELATWLPHSSTLRDAQENTGRT